MQQDMTSKKMEDFKEDSMHEHEAKDSKETIIVEDGDATKSKDPSNSREEIIKPSGPLAEFRYMCGKFVNHPYVEYFITFIILCITIIVVLTFFPFVRSSSSEVKYAIDLADTVVLFIFTAESILQLIYRDIKIFKNVWLTIDLLAVIAFWVYRELVLIRSLTRVLQISSRMYEQKKLDSRIDGS